MPLYRAELLAKKPLWHGALIHDVSQVLYLPFDYDDGSNARDRSGYNNHGVIYGAARASGKIGMAIRTDGTDDYVEVPAMPQGQGWKLSEITLLAWVKPLSLTGTWNHILEHDAWYGITIYTPSADWRYAMSSDVASTGWIGTGIKPTMGAWYHVGLRWSVGDPVVRFFLDGVEVHSKSLSGSYIGGSAQPFHIGHPSPFTPNAVIDDVQQHTRELSADEIRMLMYRRL